MTLNRTNRALLPAALLLILANQPGFAQFSLGNSTFDSDTAGWTVGASDGFGMNWDSTVGRPDPGSLRLSGTFGGGSVPFAESLSECFERPPGTAVAAEVFTLAESSGGLVSCFPVVVGYSEPGCTGSRGGTGFGGVPMGDPLGEWLTKSSQLPATSSSASFRVGLNLRLSMGTGPVSCNFDSVRIVDPDAATGPTEIPSGSPTAWLALVTLLGLAALWSLRTHG